MSKILHLELDAIVNGEVLDQSGNGHNGTIEGGVTAVSDTTFSTCLDFDGTDGRIRLDSAVVGPALVQNSFTVTAWVYLDNISGDQTILGDFSGGSSSQAIHLVIRDGKPHMGFFSNDTQHDTVLNTGQWYHISFVYDYNGSNAGTQIIYIDGDDMKASSANKDPLGGYTELDLGRWSSSAHFLDGRLYGFRIYDTALAQGDIQSIMTEDPLSTFRANYPIDFNLYDKDIQNVLYIEDTSDQTLTLELKNASTQTIELQDLTAAAVSSSNYHVALRFRPGTLSSATLAGAPDGMQLAADTALNWEMTAPGTDASGMDVVYLKSTDPGLTMASDSTQSIVFENVGADAGQGARGTRVELLYQNMAFSSTPGEAFSSNREIHLSVINHRGKQNIPLHVGFVGDNGVLNDGATQNALTLRFSNTLVYDAASPDLSQLSFSQHADETLRSKIILSFDVGTAAAEEWALGDSDDIGGISITQPTGWAIDVPAAGATPEWILYPDTADQILYGINEPNGNAEYFDLLIEDIISDFPTGHTQLHIQYENIPGYWDGQMKVTIEKRPLVYHDITYDPASQDYGQRYVGIGTTTPTEKLEVDGNIKTSGSIQGDGTGDSYLMGNVGIGTTAPGTAPLDTNISYKLDVAGITSSQGLRIPGRYDLGSPSTSGIEMEVGDGSYNAIRGYNDSQGIGTIHFFDHNWGSGATGSSAGAINISGDVATTIGRWDNPTAYFQNNSDSTSEDGYLGIGTTDPTEKLDVNGNIKVSGKIEPSAGNGSSNGIVFPANPEGGSGDLASIQYYAASGEQMVLELKIENDTTDHIALMPSGNVGIGTTDPQTTLDVAGIAHFSGDQTPSTPVQGAYIGWNAIGGIGETDFINCKGLGTGGFAFYNIADNASVNSATPQMFINGDGKVGIGTTNPQAKLEVSGAGNKSLSSYNYMAPASQKLVTRGDKAGGVVVNLDREDFPTLGIIGPLHNGYSIYASGRIACSQIDVHCDQRIKKDRVQSNTAEDLDTLLRIQITDYTHIDPVTHGSAPQKKVLGQQLASVYPQAVNMKESVVVPDIMQHAASNANGEIALDKHGLKAGEKVQLLYQENGEDKVAVFSILEAGENSFRVELPAVEELFVYGREVDDFHLVDFDALSALNISATQELHKKVEALTAENKDLTFRIAALEAKLG